MSFTLLGILQSQAAAGGAGAFDLLEEQVLTSSASVVSFTSLGSYSDYRYLQLRLVTRTSPTGVANGLVGLRFNQDSGSNYAYYYLFSPGNNPSHYDTTGSNYYLAGLTNSAQNDTNAYGVNIMELFEWADTTSYTTIRSLDGRMDPQGTSYRGVGSRGGMWLNQNAVTSIQLFDNRGYNWLSGSRFSLYGVK